MGPQQIARVVIALAVAVTLAVAGAHPAVRRFEERLGLSVLAATGVPFLLLGYAFRYFDVISPRAMLDLRPAWEFGLGWIGLLVGMHVNLRRLDRLPPSFPTTMWLLALPPTLFAALACSLALWSLNVVIGSGFIRDALLLAACAAVSTPANLRLLLRGCADSTKEVITISTQLDQGAALAILALAASIFRPSQATALWELPRSGWFLVTLGVGFVFGVVIYILIRRVHRRTEEVSLILGGIALAAGTAGYLALSVPVVCALAGVILSNASYRNRGRLELALEEVERAIYLLLLFVVGTWWNPFEWQGWILGVIFALSRGYGKLLGARLAARAAPGELPRPSRLALAVLPESAFAIIVIFSASLSDALPPAEVRWAINAVVIGSVLTELFVQIVQRRIGRRESEAAAEAEGAPA